jgi:steroid delta-isomerase-like uncharacterized protein
MKAHYRRFVDEVWNQGHLAVVAELVSSDIVHHVSGPQPGPGVEGVRQFVAEIRRAFPDLRGIVEDQIAEGDKAMGRVRCTGTHDGQFAGLAPTGKQATFELIDINRFDGSGKVVEHWSLVDMLGLLQQLGAVPAFQPSRSS